MHLAPVAGADESYMQRHTVALCHAAPGLSAVGAASGIRGARGRSRKVRPDVFGGGARSPSSLRRSSRQPWALPARTAIGGCPRNDRKSRSSQLASAPRDPNGTISPCRCRQSTDRASSAEAPFPSLTNTHCPEVQARPVRSAATGPSGRGWRTNCTWAWRALSSHAISSVASVEASSIMTTSKRDVSSEAVSISRSTSRANLPWALRTSNRTLRVSVEVCNGDVFL